LIRNTIEILSLVSNTEREDVQPARQTDGQTDRHDLTIMS